MVAVVSGSGLGLFNAGGMSGNSDVGRGRDQVFVNTTTGNLVVQSVDETLSALGLDFAGIRTYNSQGRFDDDNGDQWRLSVHERLFGLVGTIGANNSSITKQFGDGTEVVYTWNQTRSRYESTDGDGANDFLTSNGTVWTWTDGSTRTTETYEIVNGVPNVWLIKTSNDVDGNSNTYNYSATNLLTSITMAGSAQTVSFVYSGTNLSAIQVVSNGAPQTHVRYFYDTLNRLKQVVVDLTPDDNTAPLPDVDNNGLYEPTLYQTYITTYTYEDTSRRISTITQTDGSSVAFTYENSNGAYRIKTVTDANNRTTTYTYSVPTAAGAQQSATANQTILSNQEPIDYNINNSRIVSTDTTTSNIPYNLNTNALTPGSGSGAWGTAALLPNAAPASGTTTEPRIAFDSNGNGFAMWERIRWDNGATEVVVSRYTRSNNTWATPVVLGTVTTGGTLPVSLAVDSAGNALAVWGNARTTTSAATFVRRYDAAGGTWGTVANLGTGSTKPIAAINGAFAAVTWGADNGTRVDLYAARLNGSSWTAATSLETSTTTVADQSVAIDNQGNVVVAFIQGAATKRNRYTASSNTWSGATNFAAVAAADIKIALDSSGNGFAVWSQGADVMMSRYTRSNNTWTAAAAIDTSGQPVYATKLAMDSAGNAIVAWVQDDGAGQSVFTKRYVASTSTWSSVAVVENSTQLVSADPADLGVSISGTNASVTWFQYNNKWDGWSAVFNGTTWSAPTSPLTASTDVDLQAVAVDSLGNATALVQIQGDLYFNRFTAGSGAAYYTMPANADWPTVAGALYGINSVAAGQALSTAMPGVSLAQGNQVSGWVSQIVVPTTTAVPPYYLVPGSPFVLSWQSIAADVYGINSAAAGSKLQSILGSTYPTLSAGLKIFNMPAKLLQVQTTMPDYHYVVQSTDWAVTANAIYGSSDPGIIQYLQNYNGTTTLTIGQHLLTPLSFQYTVGGSSNPSYYTKTTIQDALGQQTFVEKDAQGRLTRVLTPNTETLYSYDPVTGNLASMTEDPTGLNRITTFVYDPATGLLRWTRDNLGNSVERTYNANNQLLTEVAYTGADPDAAGVGAAPTGALTTRYAYDLKNHLRFVISADGRVTENQYNTSGQRVLTFNYLAAAYPAASTFSEADLMSWTTGAGAGVRERIDYTYDPRGNLQTIKRWATTNAAGAGTGTGGIL